MKTKNILITGYPGFLGFILKKIFAGKKQYVIYTLGLKSVPEKTHIQTDLATTVPDLPDINFDIIIHAAGKAHILPTTREDRESFYKVNSDGTKNLICAIKNLTYPPRSFIFISTVAVYGVETGQLLDENTPLKPTTPYGDSKKLAEDFINNWGSSTKKIIVRLPLLVGKNPPGNLGKMINAIRKGYYFNVNGGIARRSMVLAEDIAGFMETLSMHEGIYNLTDGYHPSYKEMGMEISSIIKGGGSTNLNIPYSFFKLFALTGDLLEKITKKSFPVNSLLLQKITSDLTFSDEKARTELEWKPRNVLDELPTVIQ
jgi:nucleoside-diphosphate-sugar epimerase